MCLFSAICRATGISKETTSENYFCSRQGRPPAGHSTIWGSVYSRQSILERSLPFLGSIFPPHLAIAQSLVRSSDDIRWYAWWNSSILLNRVQFQNWNIINGLVNVLHGLIFFLQAEFSAYWQHNKIFKQRCGKIAKYKLCLLNGEGKYQSETDV